MKFQVCLATAGKATIGVGRYMHYPLATELLKTDQDTLLTLTRSARSLLKMIFFVVVSFIVVAVLMQIMSRYDLPVRWLGLLPAGILAETVRRYYDNVWVIGRDRVTHYRGRLSLSYAVPTVRYTDMRAINVDQDIWGRILDYGNVELGTAGTDGFELVLIGVRSPTRLAEMLDELRTASIESTHAASGGNMSDLKAALSSD